MKDEEKRVRKITERVFRSIKGRSYPESSDKDVIMAVTNVLATYVASYIYYLPPVKLFGVDTDERERDCQENLRKMVASLQEEMYISAQTGISVHFGITAECVDHER
jgi:hypothetical protein